MNADATSRVHQYPVIREYLTPAPHTIEPGQSLAAAFKAMQDLGVPHLPVVHDGRVIGTISQRDILLIESLPSVDSAAVHVEEAMVQDVCTVSPDTPIGEAIETMIDRKLGSAVACEDDRVVGVFTALDALRALHDLLQRP